MAIVKGFKLPPITVKGGLNKNKSSRFFSKGGLKVYFSDGLQRINARRWRPRWIHYNEDQLRTMDHFTAAECAYKALPKSIREALRQYYESKGGSSRTGLDFYRWFKKIFITGEIDDFIAQVLGIKLVLTKEEETHAKARLKLKAEDATPGTEYIEWNDGKHHYKTRLAKCWIPYDYAAVLIMKDKPDPDHIVTSFLKQLPKSNETRITVDKTDLYYRFGDGDYYVAVSYNGNWSNPVKITVTWWLYEFWPLEGFYYRNLSQNIERHVTDVGVSIVNYPEERLGMFPIIPQYWTTLWVEDRAGLSYCDYDYLDITFDVYKYRNRLLVRVYGTDGIDLNEVIYRDSEGKEHFICYCPAGNKDLCAEVQLKTYGRHVIKIKRYM